MLDDVFWLSFITLALIFIIMGYMGYYTYKHIQMDAKAHEDKPSKAVKN